MEMKQTADLSQASTVLGCFPSGAHRRLLWPVEARRELFREAVNLAGQSKRPELAGLLEAQEAEAEALWHRPTPRNKKTAAALSLASGIDELGPASLILAMTGDKVRAQALIDDLPRAIPGTLSYSQIIPWRAPSWR